MTDSRLFVRVGYIIEKISKWNTLCVHARKEGFVFVIYPMEENGERLEKMEQCEGNPYRQEEEQVGNRII